ncbi:hypothetical protein AB0N07_47835 [Streptomyces sp. NPDC051172]|uniref:hypothetical protein n=1 Tax=Streptomyces sp. NPDC051172 TaxID=3155796 RepID=UPI00342DD501
MALRRGRPVEQFLGPAGSPERPGIRYIEVRPAKTRYEIHLHTLEDVGHETFVDVVEFPPLYTDDEEEEFGRLVATCEARSSPSQPLKTSPERDAKVGQRWRGPGRVSRLRVGRTAGKQLARWTALARAAAQTLTINGITELRPEP